MSDVPVIYLVDDDLSVRRSLSRMLRTKGWTVQTFDSGCAFLAARPTAASGCVVLDLEMPGTSGLEVQQELLKANCPLPIVFLTGFGDIPRSVRAIKSGAADFLTKPVVAAVLIAAINDALASQSRTAADESEMAALRRRFDTLTAREIEVLRAIVAGKLNKQIAADLGIVEQTVKFHRGRLMQRMRARTVMQLLAYAARLGIS